MRKLLVILYIAVLYFSNNQVDAKNKFNSGIYLSGVVGSYQSGKSESQNGLSTISFGAGFGVPVYKNLYFYNKIIFHSKSNFSAYGNSFISKQVTGIQEIERVNASFSQIIYNGGLQFDIQFSEEIIAGLNGGLTYSILNQEVFALSGAQIQKFDDEGLFGYFGGMYIEKRFDERDLSIIAEAQYLYFKSDIIQFTRSLSGMNYSFGFKYYFTN